MHRLFASAAVAGMVVGLCTVPAAAQEILKVRIMGSDLAMSVAHGAVKACRDRGYQVSVVVLDRSGDMIAAQRDTLASRHTLEIAQRKAGLVVLSGTDSAAIRETRQDIRPELNNMLGIIVMDGGVQIRAAGSLVGAVGVSGAPTGALDAECANAGINTIRDKLEFAD